VKAQSFGRQIMQDSEQIARELEISRQPPESYAKQHVFEIDGRTSFFRFGGQTIKLKGTSKKNFALGETPWGKISRALLTVGANFVDENMVERATAGFSEPQRLSLLKSCSFMPSWLSDRIIAWYYYAQQKPESIVSVTIADGSNNANNTYPWQVSEDTVSKYCIRRSRKQHAKTFSQRENSVALNNWPVSLRPPRTNN